MATRAQIDAIRPALNVKITLSASATTDGMEAAIQVVNRQGANVAGYFPLECWISEDANGAGLTADSYSGTVTAKSNCGTILTALTAKKHFLGLTNADGLLTLLAVASANPADQYVACKRPLGGGVVVSGVSGTKWEGA
jgi:hypothetical protein